MDDLRTNDIQAQVTIPLDLLQQIDEKLGTQFKSREEFINDAIRHRLAHLQYVLPDNNTAQKKQAV